MCISDRLSDNNATWNPVKSRSSKFAMHNWSTSENCIYFQSECQWGQRRKLLTLPIYWGVHDAVFDLHVSAEVALQVELAGAVRALEGFAAGMEMHVTEEVVHSVERLSAHLKSQEHNSQCSILAPSQQVRVLTWCRNAVGSLTLHLKGLTGRWTIMCVLRVCFWTKVLKQTWHWKGLTLAWINMCLFRLADRVNSLAQTSHLNSFIPWETTKNY